MKIGHISDLHLRHYIPGTSKIKIRHSRKVLNLFKEALQWFKTQEIEILVITGDLIDTQNFILNSLDYFSNYSDFMTSCILEDYKEIKVLLEESDMPWIVLPGNHDHFGSFYSIFHDYPKSLTIGEYKFISFHDREWDGHFPRRINKERQLFEKSLIKDDFFKQIHLQHYVVTPVCNDDYPHTYFEGAYIKNRIVDSGKVILSLSGHFHKGTSLIREKNTFFSNISAFCEFPYSIRVYSIENGDVSMDTHSLRKHEFQKPIVFLDRDGVITCLPSLRSGPEDIELISGVSEAVLDLKKQGFIVIVISNQSAIGMGYLTEEIVDFTNEYISYLLVQESGDPLGQPDAYYYSQGTDDNSIHSQYDDISDKKPSVSLLKDALADLNISSDHCYFIGDRVSDLETSMAFQIVPILVRTGYGKKTEDALRNVYDNLLVFNDLKDAVDYIIDK